MYTIIHLKLLSPKSQSERLENARWLCQEMSHCHRKFSSIQVLLSQRLADGLNFRSYNMLCTGIMMFGALERGCLYIYIYALYACVLVGNYGQSLQHSC